MPARETVVLAKTSLVGVYDVTCHAPRSGFGPPEQSSLVEVVFPRRGVFIVDMAGSKAVVHDGMAWILGTHEDYRISHPASAGDNCTVLVAPDSVIEETVGSINGRIGCLNANQQLAVTVFSNSLRRTVWDQLEAEEATLLLLGSVGAAFRQPTHMERYRHRERQWARVQNVCSLLASASDRRWSLMTLAHEASWSPFHLAREFRLATGESIGTYLLRLRLGNALERLAEGERNIAALALETGFAHHSHFTARFRRVFKMTPTAARRALTNRRLQTLKTLLAPPSA